MSEKAEAMQPRIACPARSRLLVWLRDVHGVLTGDVLPLIEDVETAAEERGRRSGVEERDELRECLKLARDFVEMQAARNPIPYNLRVLKRVEDALAPRDSAPEPARMDATHGPTCWCGKPSHHESGWCGGLACQGGAPRDSAPVCNNCKRAQKAKDGRTEADIEIGPCYCATLREDRK